MVPLAGAAGKGGWAMPDMDLIEQEKQEGRDGRGRFRRGHSGNLKGRPPNPSPLAAALLLDGEAEALTRKAIDLALAGDPAALRLCLDRIVGPRRGRPVIFALPEIDDAEQLGAAITAIAAAVAQGTLTPEEALSLSQMLEGFVRSFDASRAARDRRRYAERFGQAKNRSGSGG
jgi:hypothetical protein